MIENMNNRNNDDDNNNTTDDKNKNWENHDENHENNRDSTNDDDNLNNSATAFHRKSTGSLRNKTKFKRHPDFFLLFFLNSKLDLFAATLAQELPSNLMFEAKKQKETQS